MRRQLRPIDCQLVQGIEESKLLTIQMSLLVFPDIGWIARKLIACSATVVQNIMLHLWNTSSIHTLSDVVMGTLFHCP